MALVADLFLVTHAIAGGVFLGALVACWVVVALAERADSITADVARTRAAVPFERTVMIGPLTVLAIALMVSKPF